MLISRNVLITGGTGYLGSVLSQYLSRQSYTVFSCSRRVPSQDMRYPGIHYVKLDFDFLETQKDLFSKVDTVIHMAGAPAPQFTSDPLEAFEFNVNSTRKLLDLSILTGVRNFLFLSSSRIYGYSGVINELTPPPDTLHPYAESKLFSERLVQKASQQGFINAISLRLSNCFGILDVLPESSRSLFVHDIVVQALLSNAITLQSNPLTPRDFIPLQSFLASIQFILSNVQTLNFGHTNHVVNIGSYKTRTLEAIALSIRNSIRDATGSEILFETPPSAHVSPFSYQTLYPAFNQLMMPDLFDKEISNLVVRLISSRLYNYT